MFGSHTFSVGSSSSEHLTGNQIPSITILEHSMANTLSRITPERDFRDAGDRLTYQGGHTTNNTKVKPHQLDRVQQEKSSLTFQDLFRCSMIGALTQVDQSVSYSTLKIRNTIKISKRKLADAERTSNSLILTHIRNTP
jgi:hypothetical protein